MAFYDKANLGLRIALLVTLCWPIAAIITALFLNPGNAQTIVPIIELTPLAGLFIGILSAPFALALLLQNPVVRKGFLWLCGLIGVELSIGVYFALVPISNDLGLVPLLILSATAVFFLRVAKYAKPLVVILSIVIIAITVIFIAGGREKMAKTFQSETPQAQVQTPSATPVPSKIPKQQPTSAESRQAGSSADEAQQDIPAPPPKEVSPDWTQAQRASAGNFTIEVPPCMMRAADLRCYFHITNQDDQDMLIDVNGYAGRIRLIDEQGKEYLTESVRIGSREGNELQVIVPSRVPMLGSTIFRNFTGDSVALFQIAIHRFGKGPNVKADIHDISIKR